MKKNEIRNALERELKNVQLSDRMKKDILYNAAHSKKPVQKRHTYRYVCAAAAVVVLMCASLMLRGGKVFPDMQYQQPRPLAQNNTPVAEQTAVTPEPEEIPVSEAISTPEPTPMPVPSYVGTEHGLYFHLNKNCSGMENAVWLEDLSGKQPCPVCIPFVTPTPVPLNAQALSTPEPEEVPVSEAISTPEPAPIYYGLEHSLFFHRDEHCSGMENAVVLTDLTGMLPCTKCVSYFSDYYGTERGTYYHLDEHCSGMQNAFILGDLSEKQPCPVCVLSADTAPMEENISVSD